MSETAKWYVVHTYSGYENKVAQNIEKVVEKDVYKRQAPAWRRVRTTSCSFPISLYSSFGEFISTL